MYFTVDHSFDWLLVVIQIMRITTTISKRQAGGISTACPSDTLSIVERFGRHVAEEYCFQVAEVDTDLKGSGGAEKMDAAILKLLLPFPSVVAVDLGGVLFRSECGR